MKSKTSYFSRALSVFLAVLMCLSVCALDWSGLVKASAAAAGTYDVKVYLDIGDDMYCKGTQNITLYYKGNNGTGGESNSKQEFSTFHTSSVTKTWSNVGYPSKVTVYCAGSTWAAAGVGYGVSVYVKKYGAADSAYVTIYADSSDTQNSHQSPSTDAKVSSFTDTFTSFNQYPYVNSISLLDTSTANVTVPTSGTASVSTGTATVYDQFGVAWYQAPQWSIHTSSGASATATTSSGATGITLSSSDQNDSVNVNVTNSAKDWVSNNKDGSTYQRYVYVNATLAGKTSGVKPILITNCKYYLDLNGSVSSDYKNGQYKYSDAGNIEGYGTASVTANWTGSASTVSNQTDFYTECYYGTSYSITVKANTGYTYVGLKSGSAALSGKITGKLDVRPQLRKNHSKLTVEPNSGTWNGSSNNTTLNQLYQSTADVPIPTKTGWVFTEWTKSSPFYGSLSSTTGAATYTFGADDDKTSTITAGWKRDITNTYHWLKADATTDDSTSVSGTAYNTATELELQAPDNTVETVSKNHKTWKFVGWNEQNSVTWGKSTQTASVSNNSKHKVATTSSVHTFYPVYALTTTEFYANYNYYAEDEANSYTTIEKNTTVDGDAATGAMPVPTGSDNGSGAELARYYTKSGVVYELQGWSLTNGGTTVDVPYNNGTATLNVPGAGTPTSTANLTPVELYPVYTKFGTAIKAEFNYYEDGGVLKKVVNGIAKGEATSGDVTFPGTDQVTTSYKKDGVTYTLKGWSLKTDGSDSKTFGSKVTLNTLTNPATDCYTFYPVYECTTTVRYNYYAADGSQTSLTKSTTLTKTDASTPTTADIDVASTSEINNTITLDGRTFTFIGWRTDKTSADKKLDKDTETVTLGVTDTEYQYYAVYSSDVVLTYNTTHKDITAVPTAGVQKLTQYLNAGTGNADVNNATSVKFDLNFTDIPAKTGYTFCGWDLSDSEAEEAAYTATGTATYTTKISTTMYARFTVNKVKVTFRYYDVNNEKLATAFTTTDPAEIFYDDDSREDKDDSRYIISAPTVIKDSEAYAFADNECHYYFTEWVRSDGKGFASENLNDETKAYDVTLKNVTEDITVQAHYQGITHIYETLRVKTAATCTDDGVCVKRCTVCGYVWEDAPIDSLGGHTIISEGAVERTCTRKGSTGTQFCTVCNLVVKSAEEIPALGHNYKLDHTVAPTCTTQGYDVMVCLHNSTHVVYENYQPSTGHTLDTENTSVKASCTTPGKTDKEVCTVCGAVIIDEQTTPATGHTPVVVPAEAATCTEKGLTEGAVCQTCGTVIVAQEEIAALGHEYEEVTAKDPTCTEDGWTAGNRCVRCGDGTTSETIPALGHDYTGHEADVVDSTCTVAGTSTQYCERCKKDIVTELPLADHTEELVPAAAPTCKEAGHGEYYKCSVCGKELTQKVSGNYGAHTWKVSVPKKDATCTEPGNTAAYTCDVCGKEIPSTEIPALGHKYSDATEVVATCEDPGEHYQICARCGDEVVTEIPALGHDYQPVEEVPATCIAVGYTAGSRCTRCGDIESGCEPIDKVDKHSYVYLETVKDANCTTNGVEKQICEICNTVITVSTPLEKHDMYYVEPVPATCTTIGYTDGYKCKRCSYKEGITAVAKTAHKEVVEGYEAATCTKDGSTGTTTCETCKAVIATARVIPATGHKYGTWSVGKVPTCTEDGYYIRYCINEGCIDEETGKPFAETKSYEKLGHDMTYYEAKAPGCITDGNNEYWVCSRCDGVYYKNAEGTAAYADFDKDVKIGATKHDYVSIVVAPKCETEGYTLYKCFCGDEYKDNYVDAKGHTPDPEHPATCKDKAVCEVCGKSYGGYTAHKYVTTTTPGKDCKTLGTETKTCTVCGKSSSKETNEYGDHVYTSVPTVAPTCVSKGVETFTCEVCGGTYTREIAATGVHIDNDVDGYCDICEQVISGSVADHSGICDKCGKEHGTSVGGIFGYDGIVCKILAFFHKIFGI